MFLAIKMLLDKDKIQKINFFENLTNSKVKDFLDEEKIIVVVEQGELGKALGRKAKNIKMVEKMFRKRLKIVEFSEDPLTFVKNFIYPFNAEDVKLNNNIIEITIQDRKTKGLLIGRNGRNLNELNRFVHEYYNLNVKII